MSQENIPLDASMRADDPRADDHRDDHTHQVLPDLAYKRTVFVNHAYIGLPGQGDRKWVLVDAGVTGMSAEAIEHAARDRFGEHVRPACILLTHGHFDHIGAAKELADKWDCPIYAHELELPYLTGQAAYPKPDPHVGGGMMATLSPLYPRGPFDLIERIEHLPNDGTVPFLPDWKWIHVPGHSPGQVAFWRESDRSLLSADAFITTRQESAYAAVTQAMELHGPPMYFTIDFEAARQSVERLAALEPELVVPGHGRAMHGPELRAKLHELVQHFAEIAVPKDGKYVKNPARVEDGSAYVS